MSFRHELLQFPDELYKGGCMTSGLLIAVFADAPRELVLLGNLGQPHDPPLPCLTFAEALVLHVVEFPQGILTCEDQPSHATGNVAKGVVFLPTAPFNGVTLLLLLGAALLPESRSPPSNAERSDPAAFMMALVRSRASDAGSAFCSNSARSTYSCVFSCMSLRASSDTFCP
jgi:hypothetical protein